MADPQSSFVSSASADETVFNVKTFKGNATIAIKDGKLVLSDKAPERDDDGQLHIRMDGATTLDDNQVMGIVGEAITIANENGKGGVMRIKDARALETLTNKVFEFKKDGFDEQEKQILQKIVKDSNLVRSK